MGKSAERRIALSGGLHFPAAADHQVDEVAPQA